MTLPEEVARGQTAFIGATCGVCNETLGTGVVVACKEGPAGFYCHTRCWDARPDGWTLEGAMARRAQARRN